MAEGLADAGADVVIASRKLDSCEKAANEITKATGRKAIGVACHVGNWDDCDALVERVYRELGRCDVLVNNAGMSPLYPSLAEVSEDMFDKVVGVNLKGPFRLSSLAGTRMAQGTGGSIINISSIASVNPTADDLVYACAKAALNTMTVGMADAFGPAVRCNTIMAGPFLTDVSGHWDMGAFEEAAQTSIPLRRAGRPDEIVGAALYLASEASSYTTGSVIKIDGGMARRTT
jgi:NAD(P)-dependent dehydrogenase (short-subunit alcohol dehydrogenase family)